MASVEIRTVDHSDFDGWLPLWNGCQWFYAVDIREAATAMTWARFLASSVPVHAAIAMVDGHAFGLAHWIYHRSTWTTDDYCYLQDLFVADDARGSGLGRALIEHVTADGMRQGAPRVYWSTHESNQNAIHLYDRVGERSRFVQYRKLLA
jgi:ribosomal protein S18 acetylase RimI-like enzyme